MRTLLSSWKHRQGLSMRQWVLIGVLCLGLAGILHHYVRIGINTSASLNARLFVVLKQAVPTARGEYVVFRSVGEGGLHPRGTLFTKIIAGIPGDAIQVSAQGLVAVAGRTIGYARSQSSKGVKLAPIAPGIVPRDHFFVTGQSDDSFDSRYLAVGLIPKDRIVGQAYVIF
jgi:conjugal transfer pilin signal peptidase TrbI